MSLIKFKPTTPSRRHMSGPDFSEITKTRPEKSLLLPLKKSGGRNAYGRMTVRHRGGGHKRMLRIIDFKRDLFEVPAKVVAVEYDPNRSARIALVEYPDKQKRYILAPAGITVGAVVSSGAGSEIQIGNAMPIQEMPLGTQIHNIELHKNRGRSEE